MGTIDFWTMVASWGGRQPPTAASQLAALRPLFEYAREHADASGL
ncbi:hypothetical protein [Halobellus rufus]|nr:hypothetical protein [Halobellus rufus]